MAKLPKNKPIKRRAKYREVDREDGHGQERLTRMCNDCNRPLIVVDTFLYCPDCKKSFTIKPIKVMVLI